MCKSSYQSSTSKIPASVVLGVVLIQSVVVGVGSIEVVFPIPSRGGVVLVELVDVGQN